MAIVAAAARLCLLANCEFVTFEDNLHYLMLADSIRAGRFYEVRFRNEWGSPGPIQHVDMIYPPMFPLFLGAVRSVVGERVQAAWAACIMVNVLAAIPMALAAAKLTRSRLAAFWAASGFLWTGDFMCKSVAGMSESLAVLFAMLCLWLYLRFQDHPRLGTAMPCGLIGAAALLTRMEYLAIPAGIAVASLLAKRAPAVSQTRWLLLHVVAVAPCVAAWLGWEVVRAFWLAPSPSLPQYWQHLLMNLRLEHYPLPHLRLDMASVIGLVTRRSAAGMCTLVRLVVGRVASLSLMLPLGLGIISWLCRPAMRSERAHVACLCIAAISFLIHALYLLTPYHPIWPHQVSGLLPWLMLLAAPGCAFLWRTCAALPSEGAWLTPHRAVTLALFASLAIVCSTEARGAFRTLRQSKQDAAEVMAVARWIRENTAENEHVFARRAVSICYGSNREVVMIPVVVSENGLRDMAKYYHVTHFCNWLYEGPVPADWLPIARGAWGVIYRTGEGATQ
jgi:hypothetical protein